jgi:hypothetical protein
MKVELSGNTTPVEAYALGMEVACEAIGAELARMRFATECDCLDCLHEAIDRVLRGELDA